MENANKREVKNEGVIDNETVLHIAKQLKVVSAQINNIEELIEVQTEHIDTLLEHLTIPGQLVSKLMDAVNRRAVELTGVDSGNDFEKCREMLSSDFEAYMGLKESWSGITAKNYKKGLDFIAEWSV